MKLPKIKLSNKQKAFLITLGGVVALVCFLIILFSYPVETIAYLIVAASIGFSCLCLWTTYKMVLSWLENRR